MQTLTLDKLPTPVLLVWGLAEYFCVYEDGDKYTIMLPPEFIRSKTLFTNPIATISKKGVQLIGRLSELTDREILQGISAKGYYFTNPKGEEPDTRCSAYTDMYTIAKNARMWDEWNEFESKTLPENTLIFKRV